MNHPKYRPDIDGLRAVAVLSVLVFHAFPDVLKAGFIGVDIFFVISGFLISSIIFENLDRGSFSFSEFYGRRVQRIFPALALILMFCLVFGWFGLLKDEYQQLGKHVAAGAGFVSNFALWQESGYFDNAAEIKPLLHLWSLAIEEQFYIVWPLLVWLLWKRKVLFWIVVGTLLIGSFLISTYLVRVDRSAAFYFPGSRIWELLAGVILAYFAVRPSLWQPSTAQRNAASFIGVTLLALAFFKIDKNRPYPGSWALLPGLGAFLIVFAGSKTWFNRMVLSNKLLVWVGLISFPLYLWHWPILSFMRIIESGTPETSYRIAAMGLSIFLAWLTYRFVEKPIRRPVNTDSAANIKLKTILLTGLVAALGLIGWYIHQSNGVENRVAARVTGVNVWNNFAFRKGCHDITNDKDQDDWCNMGNAPNLPPTTLLIGDSVGNGFAPMLQAYAEQNADTPFIFKQIGRGGCHGLPKIGMSHCNELVAATDRLIANTPSIHTIILASNWSIYSHGFDRPGFSHVSGAEFKAKFEERVIHYQRLGKRVIVFWAPPVGANPRECVVRPIRISDKNTCIFSRKDAVENEHNYRSIFEPFLTRHGVATFDPVKYLCDEKTCKVTDGTQIYYLDHVHFSIFGGQYLAKLANDELKHLLANEIRPTGKITRDLD
jgi:peptidoglycan/LPS O-acetylase OafA/YrhL